MTITPPSTFVNLHGHSTLSIGDAIGLPQHHLKFAFENGSTALALTDHGNAAGHSHAFAGMKELAKQGKKIKSIPGVEAYFIDSLQDWKRLYESARESGELSRNSKKTTKASKPEIATIGNELADAEKELAEKFQNADTENTEGSGTLVEDEAESKQQKWKNPLYQRNHLVLLPKNAAGLKAIYSLISESNIRGFYRMPRMDFDMLQRYCNGNVVALTAGLAGVPTKVICDNLPAGDVISFDPTYLSHNKEKIQAGLKTYIDRFQEALGPENFFLEIQFNKLPLQHLVNLHILEAARKFGVKVVATADSHYSNPSEWKEREIYKMMAWASKTKGAIDASTIPQSVEDLKCELYPKNHMQMWESFLKTSAPYAEAYAPYFDDVRQAIELTYDIAHQLIQDVEIDSKVKLPALAKIASPPDGLDALMARSKDEDDAAGRELARMAVEGLKRKGKISPDYVERLKMELEVVKHLKFSKYFLTYSKVMEVTGKEMLIGNARGSAGGSLLAYAIGVTQVDPIRFNLLFERFLNFKKQGFPDIDSDFSDRDRAVKILTEFFGSDSVIPVSNFAQLQLKSLIKDLGRFYGIPFEQLNPVTARVEAEVLKEKKKEPGFDRGTWVLTFEDAFEHSESFRELLDVHPELSRGIQVLFKQMRNISRHAGGVIITEEASKNMPLLASKGEMQTPWPEGVNYRHLESFGFLKFDILGIGTLRIFESCIRRILKKEGNPNPSFQDVKNWFDENLHPDNNDMDDMTVYKNVFWEGRYAGIFQFVKANTQEFMRKMKPQSVIDIAVATSIFRPGPLGLKVDKDFLDNRLYPDNVQYKHPVLREVFAETSGLLVFQEQLQMIYHKMAGVPLNDTDGVRKAFTKKEISGKEKAEKERQELRTTFIRLCEEHDGTPESVSAPLFDNMQKLVAYSFNKSHAVAYAITSYQCAWLLTYYPNEWIVSYLDYSVNGKGKVVGQEDPKVVALGEAKVLGYTLEKADINYSEEEFTLHPTKPKTIVASFSSLKGLGAAAIQEIKEHRPYSSIYDILMSPNGWRHSKFNKRAIETLINLEALDSIGEVGDGKLFPNYRAVRAVVMDNFDDLKRISKLKKNNNPKIRYDELVASVQSTPDFTDEEKRTFMSELSGAVDFDLIVSPEIRYRLQEAGIESVDFWESKSVKCWAIVKSSMIAMTTTGKKYLKMRVVAETGKEYTMSVWSWLSHEIPKEGSMIIGNFDKDDFGFKAFPNNFETVVLTEDVALPV
jgi:DNA polymerase-3 subunit alpha